METGRHAEVVLERFALDIGPNGFKYPVTVIEIELRLTEADLHINKDVFRISGVEHKGSLAKGGRLFIGIGSREPINRVSDFVGFSRKDIAPRLRFASQNASDLLPLDGLHFDHQLGIPLDGYSFTDCTFTKCRLMFSVRPFTLSGCNFYASAVVLTDEAVSTCRALPRSTNSSSAKGPGGAESTMGRTPSWTGSQNIDKAVTRPAFLRSNPKAEKNNRFPAFSEWRVIRKLGRKGKKLLSIKPIDGSDRDEYRAHFSSRISIRKLV